MVTGKPRCYQPQEFKDIAIQDLKTSDFTCQGTYVVLVLAGVFVCVSGYVPLAGVVWRNVCLNVRHFVSSEPADVNHVGCHSGRVPCCTYGGPGKSLLHTTD